MRTFGSLSLLVANLFAPAIAAEWKLVAQNTDANIYIDAQSIKRRGAVVEYWQLMDFNRAKTNRSGLEYRSMKSQYEADCVRRELRMTFVTVYTGGGGQGGVVDYGPAKEQFRPVVPGTSLELLSRFVCTADKVKP
jgi:hypothetical protein